MNQRNTFHYGILKDFNSTYIMLPLKGNTYRKPVKMIIILPDKQTNLSNILSNFSSSELRSLMNNTDNEVHVRISLPKFEIKSKINLKDVQQTVKFLFQLLYYHNKFLLLINFIYIYIY